MGGLLSKEQVHSGGIDISSIRKTGRPSMTRTNVPDFIVRFF